MGQMVILLHMHKCAGSAIVQAAIDSGMQLPSQHQNGNLCRDDGTPVLYRNLSRADLKDLLRAQMDLGVTFLSMEWDFPLIEDFPDDLDLRFITTLRDPMERVASNFRMDKVHGWFDLASTFEQYVNGDALYRSHNYYVRKLCKLYPVDEIKQSHFDYACAVLKAFDGAVPTEKSLIDEMLHSLGFVAWETKSVNVGNRRRMQEKGDDHFVISPEQQDWFTFRNGWDVALFEWTQLKAKKSPT